MFGKTVDGKIAQNLFSNVINPFKSLAILKSSTSSNYYENSGADGSFGRQKKHRHFYVKG